jgi:hypothetical protein
LEQFEPEEGIMNIIKVLILTLSAIIIAGCVTTDPKTPPVLSSMERTYGINVDLPSTWKSRDYPFSVNAEGKYFRCFINLTSPYPSARSSLTRLFICTPWGGDGGLGDFVMASWKDYTHINKNFTKPYERGDSEDFSFVDGQGRKWVGKQFFDMLYGTNSITGNPFVKRVVHSFFPLQTFKGGKEWFVWVIYDDPVKSGIEITQPYSHGLQYVLDRISVVKK